MQKIKAAEFLELAGEALATVNESFRNIPKRAYVDIVQGKSRGSAAANFRIDVAESGLVLGKIGKNNYQLLGESDAELITVTGFANAVRLSWPQWPGEYIEKSARGVMGNEYDSIAPAAGTGVFHIMRDTGTVIATTRYKRDSEVKIFELIA